MLRKPFVFGFLSLMLSASAQAQNYVPGEVIVKLKSKHGSAETYSFMGKAGSSHKIALKQSFSRMNMYHFGLKPGAKVEDALADLKNDPTVLYAEPNYYLTKSADTGLQQTFSAEEIHTASAQSQSANLATSANIGAQSVWVASGMPQTRPIVAVIDTGLDTTHNVFATSGAVWTNPGEIAGNHIDDDSNGFVDDVHGWNFVDNSPTMYDDDGHGTHVSGVILSLDQNIFAATLQPAKIQIMPLKFLNGNGVGTTSDAIRAIYYAANMGAAVLNNSWGGSDYSAALHEAVAYSYDKGAVFVAAAGNSHSNNDALPMYPSSYGVPNVVSVAATTDYDYLASFSNYGGSTVHLGSPGVYILSTIPNNTFGTMSGTSMATPFVAGTAAQIKVSSPNMLAFQVREILVAQTHSVSQLQGRVSSSGRLDSSGAVTYAKTASVDSSQPPYTISYAGDRELASTMTGTGCGLVRSMDEKGGEPPFGSSFAVVCLLLAPIVVLLALRLRSPENRRKHERFKVNSDVRISVGDRELVGSISSLSLGGAQVNTTALLQDGGLVTLSISSPNGDEKVEIAGRVVWSAANKAYGVAFDQAQQSVLSRIGDWTRSLKRAA